VVITGTSLMLMRRRAVATIGFDPSSPLVIAVAESVVMATGRRRAARRDSCRIRGYLLTIHDRLSLRNTPSVNVHLFQCVAHLPCDVRYDVIKN